MKSPNLFLIFFLSTVQHSAYVELFTKHFGRVATKVNDVKIFTVLYHIYHSMNERRSALPLIRASASLKNGMQERYHFPISYIRRQN